MADNITLNSGSGGDTAAADDISGVKYQRVKITLGADGVNDGDVSSANAMPVSGSVSIAAVATGGATFSKIRSAASTNTTNLKASAGKVVSIFLQNNGTVQQFVKLHNVSSTPTAGASVAMTFVVNPGDTVNWHGGDQGMAFGAGIGYSITAGQAESDTANATADAVLGVITWL